MAVEKDWLLVSYLRQNCRRRLTDISKATKVPISTLYDRMRLLESSGLLRHSALLNFAALGFSTRAVILIHVPRKAQSTCGRFLASHSQVNSLFKVNNGYNFLVEAVFRSLQDLEEFTDGLDVQFEGSHQTLQIVDDLRREAFLSDPLLLPPIMSDCRISPRAASGFVQGLAEEKFK